MSSSGTTGGALNDIAGVYQIAARSAPGCRRQSKGRMVGQKGALCAKPGRVLVRDAQQGQGRNVGPGALRRNEARETSGMLQMIFRLRNRLAFAFPTPQKFVSDV